jgi:hypothetical protein
MQELQIGAGDEVTSQPLTVMLSHDFCPTHNFRLISVPRDSDSRLPVTFKCPLKDCSGK